jgi:phosphomevalonate kinase
MAIIARMQQISEQSIKQLNRQNLEGFLPLCNKYYDMMRELGLESQADIISQAHRELAEIAWASGAYYKPSGAGGGDMGLVFTDSKTVARKVSDNILRSNYQMLNFKIANSGSRLEL